MRTLSLLVVAFTVAAARAGAQDAEASRFDPWTFDLSGFTVDPPDDDAYAAGILRVDREELHLEGRWNYEDRHTASFWAGWNLDWPATEEEGFAIAVTPMVGLVTGDTDGFAPGVLLDASWWLLELWNESEYLFDADDSDDDYFYSWTELSLSPVEWLRFGLVGQRT